MTNDTAHPLQNTHAVPRTLVHDLRNAVAPIRNSVQLLRLRGGGDASLVKVTDIIDRQVNEIVRLLNLLGEAAGDVAAPAGAGGQSAQQAAAESIRRSVLIVDDNAAFSTSLCSVLAEAGHVVKTAADGAAALAIAQSWQPEFVLLDVHMPGMNGYEAAKRIRALYPPDIMKLILVTGSTLDETTLRGARRAGFDHCIDKINGIAALEVLLRSTPD